MANFNIGTRVETTENTIEVSLEGVAPGKHRFQLVVVDEAGTESIPSACDVIIRDREKPTAVLQIEPASVPFGQPFKLNGARSSELPPGKIVKYVWTLME
ncbi:MAG: hypothetical protein ABSG46_09280 [Candidatus Binataceae bacterium]|jgi:hypothetical protein